MSAVARKFMLARITIELESAFRTSGGDTLGSAWDQEFLVDAGGVPVIPGSSIAGILRHAYASEFNEDPDDENTRTAALFGFQESERGQASRVRVSWAQPVDSQRRVVPFRSSAERQADPAIERMMAGALRDHVRLSHLGVVDKAGKFDELVVPAGARFAFELRVDAASDPAQPNAEASLDLLLGLLDSGATRLGGSTRRGLGAFRIVKGSVTARSFDLDDAKSRELFAKLPVDLATAVPNGVLMPYAFKAVPQHCVTATIWLEPVDYLMFGGGTPYRDEHLQSKKRVDHETRAVRTETDFVDRVPVEEERIVWPDGKPPEIRSVLMIPASGLKGAVAHRAAFHDRRLNDRLLAPDSTIGEDDLARSRDLTTLFGDMKDRNDTDARAGCVFFNDAVVSAPKFGRQQHVSLDRFTQAPMDGFLFAEAPLFGGKLALQVSIDTRRGVDVPAKTRRAFATALDDLISRRLAVGAAGARGFGLCTGTIAWSDKGAWINGGAA